MNICFFADARSPIAQNWIRHFISTGAKIHVISSYPCPSDIFAPTSLSIVPIAFAWLRGNQHSGVASKSAPRMAIMRLMNQLKRNINLSLMASIQRWLTPLELPVHHKKFQDIIGNLNPDLVHIMRMPFEGIFAARALQQTKIPLIASIWGNDFTLQAKASPLLAYLNRQALKRIDALHPDCHRDLNLAFSAGFCSQKPSMVLPSGGGVQKEIFYPGLQDRSFLAQWNLPAEVPLVVNPRGIREYIRNDTFFRSIPAVISKKPGTVFVCVGMQGNSTAERWVKKLSLQKVVRLLPLLRRSEMANLFRSATVTVSPSEHDGTPNSLLEAMACGAFPVAGDIESIREWIDDRVNGLLCNPGDPAALATAIIVALEGKELRQKAAIINQKLIKQKADHPAVMAQAKKFYEEVIAYKQHHERAV
jgi:glycosyltransferase involved in cell wall biosynthesis